MNAIARQEPGSKLKGSFTDCTLPGKPFIWLPFAGGISAFAVHPAEAHGDRPWDRWRLSGRVPRERMLRRDARSKSCQEFRFLMFDPGLPAMDIIFNEPEAVSPDLQKWAPH